MTEPRCSATDVDPDDWFIERDGKQYPDDVLVTEVEVAEALMAFPIGEEVDEAQLRADLEAAALKRQLQRRRHAKDACYQCPLRLQCLQYALEHNIQHGTWGGYYQEELRKIRKLIQERQQA